jgi:hypothetical protein
MSSIENQHGREERTKFPFISFPELAGGKNLQATSTTVDLALVLKDNNF